MLIPGEREAPDDLGIGSAGASLASVGTVGSPLEPWPPVGTVG